jgi:outer membrane protein
VALFEATISLVSMPTRIRIESLLIRLSASVGCLVVITWNIPAMSAGESTDGVPVQLRPTMGASNLPAAPAFTIESAVATALKTYPQIEARLEQTKAARAKILAQREQEYLPKAYSTFEEVAASHNKVTQSIFNDPVFVQNPGPGKPYQTWRGNIFSGGGVLTDWDPIDFGLHKARISEVKAQFKQSESVLAVTQLDVAIGAANAFLTLVVAQEQVRAAQANVKRMEVVREVVTTLVNNGLRPGVDASLADAQLADMRNTLIQAQEYEQEMVAALAAAMGQAGSEPLIDPRPVARKEGPPVLTVTTPNFSAHPLSIAQESVIGVLVAQKKVLAKSIYPDIRFLSGLNWRGSGLNDTNASFQKQDGFGWIPRVYNWNVGVIVNFQFLDWIRIRQEEVVQQHQILAGRAQYAQVIQNLKQDDQRARAKLEGAIKFASNTPIEVNAAQEAELRARTRYKTGLGTIEEVADAERMLARAEVQDAIARVSVWKALLAIANSRGTIEPFLTQIAAARTTTP